MAETRTQSEWQSQIDSIYTSLPTDSSSWTSYPVPEQKEFAKLIDHTLLKLDATNEQIDKLCEEARTYNFKSVCVRLNFVERAVKNLEGSDVVVACVIDFHKGTAPTASKVAETKSALQSGAEELDLVIPFDLLHSATEPGSESYISLYHTILAVRNAAPSPIILKTIFETSQLSVKEIVAASVIAKEAGVDFVKTSTGFNGRGASVEDVRVMKAVVGDKVGVKASGGVRSAEDVVKMVEAGATRVGTSGGVGIMEGAKGGSGGY